MKEDEKKIISRREAYMLNKRAFLILYRRLPQMFLSRFICLAWNASAPYVEIYLSALMIGELAGNRDPERLKALILITLLSSAAIYLVKILLEKWRDASYVGTPDIVEKVYCEKFMEMDFVDMDDAKTHTMYTTIQQSRAGGGGLHSVIKDFEKIVSSIFTILGGISLTVSLFVSRVPEGAGKYQILNHPLCIVIIICIMLTVTLISPSLKVMANAVIIKENALIRLGNRMFWFYGFLGFQSELAADVRIYEQNKMCNKYNQDKSGVFESEGPLARYSWGVVGILHAAAASVSVVFTGIVYLFVCLKAWAGAFGVGAVTQYVAAITKVFGGVSELLARLGTMRSNAVFLKMTMDFLDIPNNMYQGSLTVEKRCDRDYEVEFRNVSFCYPGSEAYVIKNVSVKFKIGQRLAVVGRNGSGKTTFIKLLCRLYDPTEGEILLNGIDIRKYDYVDYMSIFSVVFQDFKLLALPLGENVAAGMQYDEKRVLECLEKVGFAERLAQMPDGLKTYLYKDFSTEGVGVSGGEAQKIAMARALYKDAPFIILDEPTAALDPIAEADIYGRFNDIVGNRTAIYISHRLSSCRFCDEILVFDNGSIVQQGSHDELVADRAGKYYELWNAQAQYYAQ